MIPAGLVRDIVIGHFRSDSAAACEGGVVGTCSSRTWTQGPRKATG
jgi:hypothetical protein